MGTASSRTGSRQPGPVEPRGMPRVARSDPAGMQSAWGARRRSLIGMAGLALAGCAVHAPTERASPPAGDSVDAGVMPADPGFARHLLDRFGYGPRPGDLERVLSTGPRAWFESQLDPDRLPPDRRLEEALARWPRLAESHGPTLQGYARLQAEFLAPGTGELRRAQAGVELREFVREVRTQATHARVLRALHGPDQLREVLVEFWFNHFNVYSGKQTVRVTAGHFEREAIRPHVLGRFRDLLGATARHPAMLDYLDNWQSTGPGRDAVEGRRAPRGTNENYARELLELHTLGVDGGYTQQDVSELARILTGWTFDRRAPGDDAFRFVPARHDRGPKRLLGREVPGNGREQGEWALDLLARHPSTARNVARRLARSFVADDPPAALVERLAGVFRDTDGDLRALVRALATSPEFAAPAARGAKFKTPYRFVLSMERALGSVTTDAAPMLAACARMGMPVHGCPSPAGWEDRREVWSGAEGLRQRIAFALRAAETARPRDVIPGTVAGVLGPATLGALEAVPARERLGLALASPDFGRH